MSEATTNGGTGYHSILETGAVPDGSTNCHQAIQDAYNNWPGEKIRVPPGDYVWSGVPIVCTPGTHLVGDSAWKSRILKMSGNDMFLVDDGNQWTDLCLDGNNQAGSLLNIQAGKGQQKVARCRLIDPNGHSIFFVDTTSGEGFDCSDSLLYSHPGSGSYAVAVQDAPQAQAYPRHFVNVEFGGQPSFDLGGSSSTYVSNSFVQDILWSPNTHACMFTNNRLSSLNPYQVDGGQNIIVGNDVYPRIILLAGTGANVIGPNSYNSAGSGAVPVQDLSGNSTNAVEHLMMPYVPGVTTTGGGALIVGAGGFIQGSYARHGDMVHCLIDMVLGGAGLFIGPGIIQFGLPPAHPLVSPIAQFMGQCRGTHAGLLYFGTPALDPAAGQWAQLQRDTTNGFTAINPVAWAAGDIFHASFAYSV